MTAVLCGASIGGSSLYAWRGTTGEPRLFLTGPLITMTSASLQRLLPENRRSEGSSLAFTVQTTGFGLGSLGVGVLPLRLTPLFGTFSAAIIVVMLGTRPRRTVGTASVTS
ncbi:hypothetical protein ACFWX6_14855 [Amycolatopsis sp. NPDC059019]|uniref:hypothetical protein n=1 Tax=unclassified Amycolatopsis TaxID=2618356 RepID=UPI003673454B